MADDAGSVRIDSTSERLFKAGRFSRNNEIASRNGPVNKSPNIGYGGAPVKTQPRGILQQMNVGDINSTVDHLNNEIATQISGKGGQVNSSG